MELDLKGKVALVTGGSYGLGVVFATALAEAGADVALDGPLGGPPREGGGGPVHHRARGERSRRRRDDRQRRRACRSGCGAAPRQDRRAREQRGHQREHGEVERADDERALPSGARRRRDGRVALRARCRAPHARASVGFDHQHRLDLRHGRHRIREPRHITRPRQPSSSSRASSRASGPIGECGSTPSVRASS